MSDNPDKLSLRFLMNLENDHLKEIALLSTFSTICRSEGKEMNGIGMILSPDSVTGLGFDLEERGTPLEGNSPFGSTSYLPSGRYF